MPSWGPTPRSTANPVEYLSRGAFTSFDSPVKEADVVKRRVLPGKQEGAFAGAGQLTVGVGLAHAVVGVGAAHPGVQHATPI